MNILIVDDNRTTTAIMRGIIGRHFPKSRCKALNNGYAALKYLGTIQSRDRAAAHPDLLLIDYGMPIIGGNEFLQIYGKLFFKKFPRTTVKVISAFPKRDIEREVGRYRFINEVLEKPFQVDYVSLAAGAVGQA